MALEEIFYDFLPDETYKWQHEVQAPIGNTYCTPNQIETRGARDLFKDTLGNDSTPLIEFLNESGVDYAVIIRICPAMYYDDEISVVEVTANILLDYLGMTLYKLWA